MAKLILIRALLAAAIALWLTTSAWAGFDEGLAAYQRGDYAAALEQWQPLAGGGDARAQFNLGRLYAKGEGVSLDFAEAARWYGLAAEQGHGAAQFNLADLYKYGKGVPQGYVRAYMWWSVAATGGFEEADLHRDIVSEWMPAADIAEAQRLAREWLAAHGE
jgi:TPR repeat protein